MATDPDAALHRAKPGKYKPRSPAAAALPPLPSTGTIADTIEQLPDLRAVRPLTAPIEDPASLGETFSAAKRVMRSDRMDFDEIMIRDGYQPIVDALGLPGSENPAAFDTEGTMPLAGGASMFGKPSTLATQAGQGESLFGDRTRLASRELQERLIVEQIRRHRLTEPKFMPGVPDTVEGLRAYFLANEKTKRAAAQATQARSSGFAGGLASLAGGVFEAMHDPINLVTMPIGGGGKTILQVAAREAIVNGAIELASQPFVAENRAELGEHLTPGEAAANVGMAALGGATLGSALHVGGRIVAPLAKPVAEAAARKVNEAAAALAARGMQIHIDPKLPIDRALAGLDNRSLVAIHRELAGDRATPDELAAANVLERSHDVADTSPYRAGPAGDGAHEAGLAAALKDLEDNRPPEEFPSSSAGAGEAEAATPIAAPARPRAASTGPRPHAARAPHFSPEIYQGLKARGIPDHIARGAAAGSYAEAAKGALAHNPASGAMGIGQWLGPRQQELIRRYGRNPNLEQQLDYLAYELKGGDAGGAAVLAAKDEVAALDAYIRKFMRPAAGAETSGDLERGMRALGRGGEAVPEAGQGAMLASGDDPAIARLKAEAVQLDDQVVGLTRRPDGSTVIAGSRSVPSSKILVDAERFQFKSDGDQFGVSERLRGVKEFDPILSGRVILWEEGGGKLFVADGHQRVGLARRISSESGKDVPIDAIVLREADGVSAEDARVMAALKNMAEGTGTAVDAAKVLRDAPELADRLPPRSALVRDGGALSRLSDDAFGAVYNGVIAPDIAAVIGHLAGDRPELHAGLVDLLVKLDPSSRGQADSIVRQALAGAEQGGAGFHRETQDELFGAREMIQPLMLERAKVLEKGLAKIRKLGLVHRTAAREKVTLEATGSHIAAERSAREAQANEQAAEILQRLAFRAGPVADALNAAARDLAGGAEAGSVVNRFIADVRQLNLGELDKGTGLDRGSAGAGGVGRGRDAGEALEELRGEPEQPSLEDLQAAAERFSDPDGKAVQQQADSLAHDFKAELDPAARREQIKAATAALEGAKPGEFRTVEPFKAEEPGYHRFRYVARDGTDVGGSYTLDGDLIEGFNVGDTNNPTKLGAAEVRNLFAELQRQHPEVTRVHAYRMTGARAAAGDGPKEIWIDLTGKGDGTAPGDVEIHGEPAPHDPAIAERQRQELALRAASPLRPGDVDAQGEIGLSLFDQADQLGMHLGDEGRSLLDELAADEKAIKAIKDCL